MKIKYDPFDDKDRDKSDKINHFVSQLKMDKQENLSVDGATDKQIWKLKSLGYIGDASKLSKLEASDEIKKLEGDK